MDLALPRLGVVDVAVFRSDVEISEDRELRMPRQLIPQPLAQSRIPLELVLVFVRADGLAVGGIQAHDAHAADGRRNDALVLVDEPWDSRLHVVERAAGQDRDTVVSLLPRKCSRITRGRQFVARKFRVLELKLLQAHHVRLRGVQPVDEMAEANLEGIDVPGGQLHFFPMAPLKSALLGNENGAHTMPRTTTRGSYHCDAAGHRPADRVRGKRGTIPPPAGCRRQPVLRHGNARPSPRRAHCADRVFPRTR